MIPLSSDVYAGLATSAAKGAVLRELAAEQPPHTAIAFCWDGRRPAPSAVLAAATSTGATVGASVNGDEGEAGGGSSSTTAGIGRSGCCRHWCCDDEGNMPVFVGVALGAGTAIEAQLRRCASVALVHEELTGVASVIALCRAAVRTMRSASTRMQEDGAVRGDGLWECRE